MRPGALHTEGVMGVVLGSFRVTLCDRDAGTARVSAATRNQPDVAAMASSARRAGRDEITARQGRWA